MRDPDDSSPSTLPPPPPSGTGRLAAPPSAATTAKVATEKERVFVGTGPFWSLVIFVVLGVIAVIFVLQNADEVPLEFLRWDWAVPLAGIILGAVLVGVILDELFGLFYRRRRRKRLQQSSSA